MFRDDVEDYFVEQESDEQAAESTSELDDSGQSSASRVIEFTEEQSEQSNQSEQSQAESPTAPKASRKFPSWLIKTLIVVALVGAVIGYFRYYSPIVDCAVLDGSVENVQRRGVIFKTYEAEIVDRGKVVPVSIADEAVFLKLQSHQSSGEIIRVNYCRYVATLPWRGESEVVVTGVVDK